MLAATNRIFIRRETTRRKARKETRKWGRKLRRKEKKSEASEATIMNFEYFTRFKFLFEINGFFFSEL